MLVRLLQATCNRERSTAHLQELLAQAKGENAARPVNPATPRGRPKRLDPGVIAGIIEDYEAGMKSTEIARKYRVNEWTVHHRLKRAGIVKRPGSMNEDEVTLVCSLRADGLSYDRIAERVGFSASTVRNMLKRTNT